MAEPWFRCHADLANKRVTWRLARELNVALPTAAGMLTFLWGRLSIEYAAGRFDGDIRTVTPDMIEQYAHWRGEKGAFAQWVLMRHCDPDTGKIREWDTYMGALTRQREQNRQRVASWREQNRERDNEKQRQRREKERIERAQQQSNDVTVTSTAAAADVTNYVAPVKTLDLNKLISEIVNDNAIKDKSLSANGTEPASRDYTSELLRSVLERYFAAFYADASDERVENVAWQLQGTLSERGAFVARNEARACATRRTLFNALTDTLSERATIRDRDSAIVVTLKKLQSGKANLDVDEHGETVTERVSRGTRELDSQPIEDDRARELVETLAREKALPDPKRRPVSAEDAARIMGRVASSLRDVLDSIEHDASARENVRRSHEIDASARNDTSLDVSDD